MNSPTNQPLDRLASLRELSEYTRSSRGVRRLVTDSIPVLFMAVCFGIIAWQDSRSAVLPSFVLVIVFTMEGVTQRRAEERFRLVLAALRELESQLKVGETPSGGREVRPNNP